MSWMFFAFAVLLVLFIWQGYRKGMVRTTFLLVGSLAVFILAGVCNEPVTNYLEENTNWESGIREACRNVLEEQLADREEDNEPAADGSSYLMEVLPIPEELLTSLEDNDSVQDYEELVVDEMLDTASASVAGMIMRGIAFVLSVLIANIILRLVFYLLERIMKLPVLRLVNRLGGAAIGGLRGMLWIWIILFVIALLCNTGAGEMLGSTIQGDQVVSWLYQNNPLMRIFG